MSRSRSASRGRESKRVVACFYPATTARFAAARGIIRSCDAACETTTRNALRTFDHRALVECPAGDGCRFEPIPRLDRQREARAGREPPQTLLTDDNWICLRTRIALAGNRAQENGRRR